MENKPRIFIGSSKEGLPVATKVKEQLSGFAECVIWNEDVFRFNKSYFDTLLDIINFYDYGILVATGDDFTTSRDKVFDAPRDNVVFEFGLFLGRLGRNKVFFIWEEDSKLPSDLLGISLPSFPKKNGHAKTQAIAKACELIEREIANKAGTFDLGLLPSLPLAYGYFANFVEHTGMGLFMKRGQLIKVRLKENNKIEEREILLRDFKLSILIPDELKKDVKMDVLAARFDRGWIGIEIDTGQARPYNLYMDKNSIIEDVLQLYDVPTTLNALTKTLNMYLGKTHLGKDVSERLLERREMMAFRKVLDHEINQDSRFRGRIFTEVVDI